MGLKVLIIVIFLFITHFSTAQQFVLGVKGGVQAMTNAYPERSTREFFRPGIQAGANGGVFIDFPLPDDFSLVGEFQYNLKGRRVRFNDGNWVNAARYSFFDTPILLRKYFKLPEKEFSSFWYINIGPDISYWLGGKGRIITDGPGVDYTVVFEEPEGNTEIEKMYLHDVNRFLFGLNFGVGYTAYVLGNQRFFVEARFTYGHTYFGKHDSAYLPVLGFEDNLETNYRLLNISFGYGISIDMRNAKKGKSTLDKRKRR